MISWMVVGQAVGGKYRNDVLAVQNAILSGQGDTVILCMERL